LCEDRTGLVPINVEQYHQMIEKGILPEDSSIELLEGQLFRKDRSHLGEDPMTVGHEHAWAIRKLASLKPELEQRGWVLQTQLPITLLPNNEPEPDAAIVRAPESNYRNRHRIPQDIACVIEVADSSLHRDRTTKLRAYARGGIL